MEVTFVLFAVIKTKGNKTFESGIIRGLWKKGSPVPRFQDMKRIGFQKYTDITKLSQIKSPMQFMNMKTYLEYKRRESGAFNELKENFLHNMLCHHLNIEKAFVHFNKSSMKFNMKGL